jgi:hypothetical protein
MIQIKARPTLPDHLFSMWKLILSAPFDLDLELAVINGGVHPLVFPCRRAVGGWIDADSYQQIDVHPTHWREWHKPSDVLAASSEARSRP